MASETKHSKIWLRFESRKQNGDTIKLRIQDLPPNRIDDFVTFYTTYFVKDEAFHKAAGIAKSTEAIEEYGNLIKGMFGLNPPEIAICCLDDDSEDSNKILAVSTVQLTSKENDIDNAFKEMGIELQTNEIKGLFKIIMILEPKFPESLKKKCESYHEGRGIIVHPDYRGFGIASQIVKQRRLLIQEQKVPMTCAWMTSIGSQKAAEKDGWETVAEVSLDEMDQLTGLFFEKTVPTFKLMIATLD